MRGPGGATLLAVLAFTMADGERIWLHGTDHGAIPCAACHGRDGHGRPGAGAPRLAGLSAGGVLANLGVLAAGGGGNAVMSRIAASLTADERSAVAAYIASLP